MIRLIAAKELKSFFRSPLAYILAGLFSLIIGWIFFNLLMGYLENIQTIVSGKQGQLRFINNVIIKLFGNMNFLLMMICPILTMKTFSDELSNHTIDLYYSSSVSDLELILAKYLSSFLIGSFLLITTFIFPFIAYSVEIHDFSFIFLGYIGVLLNLGAYLSVGIFCSTLTSSSIVSAISSFSIIMAFWLISWVLQLIDNYFMVSIINHITIVLHFESLVKGLIGAHDIIYYLSFIFFFLYLSSVSLKSRNW